MENFTFNNTTKIIFGKGTEKHVGKEVKQYGSKILLHYGTESIKKSGLYETIKKSLKEDQIEFIELDHVVPNPRLNLVREGIKICRDNKIDFILAAGGGSVIDSAKAIAVGVKYDGDVWDFFRQEAIPEETLPVGVILTIPASGSETSGGTVITNEDGNYKRPVSYDFMRPKFAILNPELTLTLPLYQTACGIVDMMSHVMERYFTNTKNVDLTDHLCEATLKSIIKNAEFLMKDPDNYDLRAEIMWAGSIAHNGLLGTGRVADWGSHDIEHEISGIYDIAHGAGLAIVLPAWMKYVYKHDIARFAQFANRVWNVDYEFRYPERTALSGIERMEDFFKLIGMPTRLLDVKIGDDRFDEMAKKAADDGRPRSNFIKIHQKDMIAILRLALK
jgi:alcohol dehydrogenase